MTEVCEHGQLRRQCPLCELSVECGDLRAEIERLRGDVETRDAMMTDMANTATQLRSRVEALENHVRVAKRLFREIRGHTGGTAWGNAFWEYTAWDDATGPILAACPPVEKCQTCGGTGGIEHGGCDMDGENDSRECEQCPSCHGTGEPQP